jgi:hypothetical protein
MFLNPSQTPKKEKPQLQYTKGNNFYSVVAKSTTFLPTNSKLTNQHETKKTQKCKCRQKHRIILIPSKNPPLSHCPTRPSQTSSSAATPWRRNSNGLATNGTRTDRPSKNPPPNHCQAGPRARRQLHGVGTRTDRQPGDGLAGVPTRSMAAGPLRAVPAWSGLGGAAASGLTVVECRFGQGRNLCFNNN